MVYPITASVLDLCREIAIDSLAIDIRMRLFFIDPEWTFPLFLRVDEEFAK
jgi:hypothetical protein